MIDLSKTFEELNKNGWDTSKLTLRECALVESVYKINWEKLAKNIGSKNLELEVNMEEMINEKKRIDLLITTLICTIDDLLPEDHWIRLSNSYRKLK